ncbi:MAG TPA: class I SAM-dependent methyltransferase [Bacteroidota bacterium]|nr:class I SAM-dependent methyltransferase [Bacteroidota bacterium]
MNFRFFIQVLFAYDSWVTRIYLLIRFTIIRLIMSDILSNLPEDGLIMNLGSGIGLFDLYSARFRPNANILGIDINPKRIELSRRAAQKLNLSNVEFRNGDVTRDLPEMKPQVVIMLDLLHHVEPEQRRKILEWVASHLQENGVLFIKDISTQKKWKVLFTKLLDKAMTMGGEVYYYSQEELKEALRSLGFSTATFHLWDYIPFPHIIYIAHRTSKTGEK